MVTDASLTRHELEVTGRIAKNVPSVIITITNGPVAFHIERAGLIFQAAILPQDPPQLSKEFARQLGLPRTLQPGEQVEVRLNVKDFAKAALHAQSRAGDDIVLSGLSLIDQDDGMHWYNAPGVGDFVRDFVESSFPKN